jgi:hypothetical protein
VPPPRVACVDGLCCLSTVQDDLAVCLGEATDERTPRPPWSAAIARYESEGWLVSDADTVMLCRDASSMSGAFP